MPNYLEYQKSIAAEFKAYENRVRNLIDGVHWGEEGRYKEIILMNYLKRVLPKNLSVGTGFIRNNNNITSQIDIIIYDNSFPVLFSEGDFVIATPRNVIGIIEVKTRIEPSNICELIEKANKNADIISGNTPLQIFNGVFSFNSNANTNENSADRYINALQRYSYKQLLRKQCFNQVISNKLYSCVNHIALGDKYFIKLWPLGQNDSDIESPYYSLYNMKKDLAFSYFLSNLQEFAIRRNSGFLNEDLPSELLALYYPISDGKETQLIQRIYLDDHKNE